LGAIPIGPVLKITYFAVPESTDRLQLVIFRACSGLDAPKSFFIGALGQNLSVPRVKLSMGSPEVVAYNPTQLEHTKIAK
jgi:hypothetical protein